MRVLLICMLMAVNCYGQATLESVSVRTSSSMVMFFSEALDNSATFTTNYAFFPFIPHQARNIQTRDSSLSVELVRDPAGWNNFQYKGLARELNNPSIQNTVVFNTPRSDWDLWDDINRPRDAILKSDVPAGKADFLDDDGGNNYVGTTDYISVSGGWSMYCSDEDDGDPYAFVFYNLPVENPSFYMRVYLRLTQELLDDMKSNTTRFLFQANTDAPDYDSVQIGLSNDGSDVKTWSINNSADWNGATLNASVSADTWTCFEVFFPTSSTTTDMRVIVDGVEDITYTRDLSTFDDWARIDIGLAYTSEDKDNGGAYFDEFAVAQSTIGVIPAYIETNSNKHVMQIQ